MLLAADKLVSGYGKKEVLHKVSLGVETNEIVALIGHNGAGKTTAFRTLEGVIKARNGTITYEGIDITNRSPVANVKAGICFVPQEKAIFGDLIVSENLEVASFLKGRETTSGTLKIVYDLFPILKQRDTQKAGTLSGGEQRMLAFAISLMLVPKVLFLDEPSLGLAPFLALELIKTVMEINQRLKVAIILAEQNVPEAALNISNRVYVMRDGRIEWESSTQELLQKKRLWELF